MGDYEYIYSGGEKVKKGKKIILFAGIGVALVAVVVVLILVLGGGHRVIKVDEFEGDVTFERNSEEKDIEEGMNLKSEDSITTGEDGLVELLVDSDKHILAQENTSFEIISQGNEKKGLLKIKLKYGTSLIEIENKLNDNSFVEVETPNASLSVRGTTFEVSYSKENKTTFVEVTDGVVEITCGDETKEIEEGQIATVTEDGFVVVDKHLQYNDVPVFQIGHSEQGRISNVYVKELVEWEYALSDIGGAPVDEMMRDDIIIRYWYESKEEVDENIEYLKSGDYLKSNDTYTNDDGDEILTVVSATEFSTGEVSYTYRYYKEVEDGWYISLIVFSLDDLEAVGKMDVEDFLPLTNDCYYFFGLPEGVAQPVAPITLPAEPIIELDYVDSEKLISAEEVPNLFNGGVTYEELQYAIRVRDHARIKQSFEIIKNTLEIMCYEPEVAGVYSPLSGTTNSYDAEHLNRIFSVLTTDWIVDEFLPEGATCPWPENILTLVPAIGPQEDKNNVRIIRIYYGEEENEVRVDYNYRQNFNSEGTSYREGTACMFFAPDDETGKYRMNYIMEYGSQTVNADE